MVDFFRSAMSYLSGEGDAGGGSGGGNAFVGQTVDIGDGMKLKVKKVIAEGRSSLLLSLSLFYSSHLQVVMGSYLLLKIQALELTTH